MLAAVAQRCPALLPMVAWAYSQHSRLLVQHSEGVVRSQSGVRQGDPLGPLLFALTLQEPLEQVAEMDLCNETKRKYKDRGAGTLKAPPYMASQATPACSHTEHGENLDNLS
jgi:hypothetical protein